MPNNYNYESFLILSWLFIVIYIILLIGGLISTTEKHEKNIHISLVTFLIIFFSVLSKDYYKQICIGGIISPERHVVVQHNINNIPTTTYGELIHSQEFIQNEYKYNDPSLCPICLENFTNDSIISILQCKHFFHKTCLYPWLHYRYPNICPYCLSIINYSNISIV